MPNLTENDEKESETMKDSKLVLNDDYMLVELQPGDDVKICPYFYDDGKFHEDPHGSRIVHDH